MTLLDPKLHAVFTVAEDVEARVLAESDRAVVDRWLVRAAAAAAIEDVFHG